MSALTYRTQGAVHAADAARLHYVHDGGRGISRQRRGRGFSYADAKGRPVTDSKTLQRIARCAIPPAWQRVWICPDPQGHIQATGFDARGRKQYRYHPHWTQVRDLDKFGRLADFAQVLPKIRRTTRRHLAQTGMPRTKVLAACVQLLDKTLIRVGNDDYARHNQHFGLTTLHADHVSVRGSKLHFAFIGKSGVPREVDVTDRRLAQIVRRCQDLPGQELFAYRDSAGPPEGRWVDVKSDDVNSYLRAIAGQTFSAKDFRTWAATVLAMKFLQAAEPGQSMRQMSKEVSAAIKQVAARLGNTPAVCRKCYVHPAVIDGFFAGGLPAAPPPPAGRNGLSAAEVQLRDFLTVHQKALARPLTAVLEASVRKASRSRRGSKATSTRRRPARGYAPAAPRSDILSANASS